MTYEMGADGKLHEVAETSVAVAPPENNNTPETSESNNKLFVYGIFLDERQRERYHMSNPRYAVVTAFTTRHLGGGIVEAVEDSKYAVTGLVVEVAPYDAGHWSNWERLDRLEGGYSRIRVTTTDGDICWMYVAK